MIEVIGVLIFYHALTVCNPSLYKRFKVHNEVIQRY